MLQARTANACQRCKSRKLKCDDTTPACKNCEKNGEECIVMDQVTERLYTRRYIAELQERAVHLRRIVHGEPQLDDNIPSAWSDTTTKRPTGSIFNGEGSVFTLANLIAAAVSSHYSEQSVHPLGSMLAVEQVRVERLRTSPAQLPPHETAQKLLSSYFNGPHVVLPFLSRKPAYQLMERIHINHQAQDASEVTADVSRDLFQANMICAIGALVERRSTLLEEFGTPISYYLAALRHVERFSEFSGYDHAQSILLLLLFALVHDIGVGGKWDLSRQAMRICIAEGYHLKPMFPIDPEIEQMYRRTFWCAYISDRHSSCNLGRPVTIPDSDITVDLPDEHEDDFMAGKGYNSEVMILNRHIRLRRLSTKILHSPSTFNDKKEESQSIHNELLHWRAVTVVPAHFTNAWETREFMEINFHRDRMRLFAGICRHENSWSQPSTRKESLDYCLESGTAIIQAYHVLLRNGLLVTNWTFVQDILAAGFVLLYCALHLSVGRFGLSPDIFSLDGTDGRGESFSFSATINSCREILLDLSGRWRSVIPHKIAFDHLSQAVINLHEGLIRTGSASSDLGIQEVFQLDTGIQQVGGDSVNVDSRGSEDFLTTSAANSFGFSSQEFSQVFGFELRDDGATPGWLASNDGAYQHLMHLNE